MNNYNFPLNYNPYQYPYMQQQQMMQNNNYNNQQNNSTIFMRSKTIDDARNYPLAPGTVGIFITEDGKHCCTKSIGNSPFDTPNFTIYDLIRKDEKENIIKDETKQEVVEYATKKELNSYIEQFNIIGNNFGILKNVTDELKKENAQLKSEMQNIKNELGIKETKTNEYAQS